MELPKSLYHGTFWPKSKGNYPKVLKTDFGYVMATPHENWAGYFSFVSRLRHAKEAGTRLILEIDTGKLPQKIREGCVPPDGVPPAGVAFYGEEWKQDRTKIQEWWFPYVPWEACRIVEEEQREAEPGFSPLHFSSPRVR